MLRDAPGGNSVLRHVALGAALHSVFHKLGHLVGIAAAWRTDSLETTPTSACSPPTATSRCCPVVEAAGFRFCDKATEGEGFTIYYSQSNELHLDLEMWRATVILSPGTTIA